MSAKDRRDAANLAERILAQTSDPKAHYDATKIAICADIAIGLSLRKIAAKKGMPGLETIRRWLVEDEEFRVQYAIARDEQADFYADEIVELADNAEDANKARIQIDARKWVASKLKPKKWGDRQMVEHSGSMDVRQFLLDSE